MAHIFTFVNKPVLTNYSVLLALRQAVVKVGTFIFLFRFPQSDRFCTNDLHRTFAWKFRLKVCWRLLHALFSHSSPNATAYRPSFL